MRTHERFQPMGHNANIEMLNEIDINFDFYGNVTQRITTTANISPVQVVEMLAAGSAWTTMQNGGEVVTLCDGHLFVIGTVEIVELEVNSFNFKTDIPHES